jgi:hypothetical protein
LVIISTLPQLAQASCRFGGNLRRETAVRRNLCVVGKTDMAPGHWFHFVGVHDYPKAKLYINGVLEAVQTFDVNWKSGDFSKLSDPLLNFQKKRRQKRLNAGIAAAAGQFLAERIPGASYLSFL